MPLLLVLDDDRERIDGFTAIAPQLGSGWTVRSWTDPAAMLDELDGCVANTGLIALEASIAGPVAQRLAGRKPACPLTLHWRHTTHDAAWALFRPLWAAGWDLELVYRYGTNWDQWHSAVWLSEAQGLLARRGDTAASRAHAANCERLARQFEGREAIYIEKFVRRVRVSHIRAHVDGRYVQALAEEILTPGLGVPARLARHPRWRFSGGRDSRFSRDSWSLGGRDVMWELHFAPEVIAEVVRFAATLPAEEVYQSLRLDELIWKLAAGTRRTEQPVFAD